MKLLLDENLPHKLRAEIAGHNVFTVVFMGWSGIENGELLGLAAAHGFDAFITKDRGIAHERNRATLPLSVIILLADANSIEAIRPLYAAMHEALRNLTPRTLVTVGP